MDRLREHEQIREEKPFLPFFFGTQTGHPQKLSNKYQEKLALFEKALASQLSPSDTLDEAFEKIVRVSLAAEFGPGILRAPGAKKMVNTIVRGIRDDHGLRKHALTLIYRYTKKAHSK